MTSICRLSTYTWKFYKLKLYFLLGFQQINEVNSEICAQSTFPDSKINYFAYFLPGRGIKGKGKTSPFSGDTFSWKSNSRPNYIATIEKRQRK